MLESNRLVTIVCRRSLIKQGTGKPASDIGEKGVLQREYWKKVSRECVYPEVNLNGNLDDYFKFKERIQIIQKWEEYVRKVVENKGKRLSCIKCCLCSSLLHKSYGSYILKISDICREKG